MTSVALGAKHTCVRTVQSQIWCSGLGGDGQLGNGENGKTSVPVKVSGADDWLRVYAGGETTCGIRPGGALWCWGENEYGEVGIGSTKQKITLPNDTGLRGVSSVALGDDHVCAMADSGLHCWGANTSSPTGLSGAGPFLSPKPVAGIDAVVLRAEGNSTCAVGSDDKLRCWGSNIAKRFETSTTLPLTKPVLVDGIPTVRGVTLGGYHLCVLTMTGAMLCRGGNANGELGNGETKDSFNWVQVPLP